MKMELGGVTAFWGAAVAGARPDAESPMWNNDFLRSALECAGVGTWQLDMIAGVTTWDAVTSDIFGMPPVAVSTGAVLPIHEDDQAGLWESLERSWRDRVPHDFVFRGLRSDGEVRWLHGLARPLPESTARPGFIAGIVCDITERKLAEDALKDRERELSAIVSNLPGVAYRCEVSPPWRMTFVSHAVEQLTGFTERDFTSGRVLYGDLIHSEDQLAVEQEVAEAVRNRTAFDLRYRICTPSGQRWVHERGQAAYNDGGLPLFIEGYIGDVHEQVAASALLRETEERNRIAIQATGDLVWDWDLISDAVTWSDVLQCSLGYENEELGDNSAWWIERLHKTDRERVASLIHAAIDDSTVTFACEYRFRRGDGTYADIYDRGYVLRDPTGRAIRMVGAMQDLTERNSVAAALRQSEALNRSIMDASADCIKIISLEGAIELMNDPGLCAMEIGGLADVKGRCWAELWPEPMQATVRAAVQEACACRAARFSGVCPTALGTPKWWDVVVTPMLTVSGEVEQLLAISRDITASRKTAEDLQWASEHDALTELPNRRSFEAHLNAATLRSMETGKNFGLLLLDLDHFKHINDTLGHAAGDHLLKTLGGRLQVSLRAADFVARLGGDEFAIIIQGVDSEDELIGIGESLLAHLQGPVRFGDRVLGASASIGGAIYPRDGETAHDLLKNADAALYALKEAGRGGTKMFHSYMREQLQSAAAQLGSARRAVAEQTILPFYQPKILLTTGRTIGFEALLRWQHPSKGIQHPEAIAEAFKDYELASKIGEQIQVCVFGDMRKWRERSIEFGRVSINAAPAEFLRDDYAERLLGRLYKEGLPPNLVEVEVTEQVFLDRGKEYVSRSLELLHGAGVRISLDDFGTGYSSLSHLRDFPVDVVKIDRTFVAKVCEDREIASIVSAVIDLAASLSIEVVAEGIERSEQAAFLESAGCRIGQGYLYGRAARADEVPFMSGLKGAPHLRFV